MSNIYIFLGKLVIGLDAKDNSVIDLINTEVASSDNPSDTLDTALQQIETTLYKSVRTDTAAAVKDFIFSVVDGIQSCDAERKAYFKLKYEFTVAPIEGKASVVDSMFEQIKNSYQTELNEFDLQVGIFNDDLDRIKKALTYLESQEAQQ